MRDLVRRLVRAITRRRRAPATIVELQRALNEHIADLAREAATPTYLLDGCTSTEAVVRAACPSPAIDTEAMVAALQQCARAAALTEAAFEAPVRFIAPATDWVAAWYGTGHVGEYELEAIPNGCWRTVSALDGTYIPCNRPTDAEPYLCDEHLAELQEVNVDG